MAELFPPWVRVRVRTNYMQQALNVAEKLGSKDVVIAVYNPEERPGPWFCFDVGERKFGIWQETGDLYEADEFGAMGDDPVDIDKLVAGEHELDLVARIERARKYAHAAGVGMAAERIITEWRNGYDAITTDPLLLRVKAILRGDQDE